MEEKTVVVTIIFHLLHFLRNNCITIVVQSDSQVCDAMDNPLINVLLLVRHLFGLFPGCHPRMGKILFMNLR